MWVGQKRPIPNLYTDKGLNNEKIVNKKSKLSSMSYLNATDTKHQIKAIYVVIFVKKCAHKIFICND